ncbi:transposase [Corynebacterium sp. zg254]|uniref:Transposase n=1 Tax=Corynebacterium zhongnanshanii TaxID=2768834 RepID=A0ABQ6VFQ8_9CORY|nr:transposase [Corynebacterium zhongnanshanii]MCR5914303.1 transposase [Corynebacterium sp. zg254]
MVKNERERVGLDDDRSLADLRAENARLSRELAESQLDYEFLLKAAAFFAVKQRERKSSN